jgi:hypothetical protein
VVVVAAAINVCLLWLYTSYPCITSDGSFNLAVHVSSTVGPLRSVSCEALGRREQAEVVVQKLLPPETRLWSATADPFVGKPLTVSVPLGGRESMSGRELRRTQFRYLAVIGQLQDGRRVGKWVEIPDCRVSRKVEATLP